MSKVLYTLTMASCVFGLGCQRNGQDVCASNELLLVWGPTLEMVESSEAGYRCFVRGGTVWVSDLNADPTGVMDQAVIELPPNAEAVGFFGVQDPLEETFEPIVLTRQGDLFVLSAKDRKITARVSGFGEAIREYCRLVSDYMAARTTVDRRDVIVERGLPLPGDLPVKDWASLLAAPDVHPYLANWVIRSCRVEEGGVLHLSSISTDAAMTRCDGRWKVTKIILRTDH